MSETAQPAPAYRNAFADRAQFTLACETTPLERRPFPSEDEFRRVYMGRRAAIFTGMFDGAGCRGWTPESLAREFGDLTVKVSTFRVPFPSVWRLMETSKRSTTLREAFAQIEQVPMLLSIPIPLPSEPIDPVTARLRDELPKVPYAMGRLESYNSFFSSTHTSWGVHKDTGTEQLLFQLYGKKAVVLFPDDARNTRALVPVRYPHPSYYRTEIPDLQNVNAKQYPLFSEAQAHVGVLEPGDTLYLPCAWWHDTRPIGTALSMNVRHVAPPFVAMRSQLKSRVYSRRFGRESSAKLPKV